MLLETKRAYIVIGPESSGTRMLTKAFISAGCFGDGGHAQRVDAPLFWQQETLPDKLVLRRSLPHAHRWPNIASLKATMEEKGYLVDVVAIVRDKNITVASQLRDFQHAKTKVQARDNIAKAEKVIVAADPRWIAQYGMFVEDADYRKGLFMMLDLPEPTIRFYNGNLKYENNLARPTRVL